MQADLSSSSCSKKKKKKLLFYHETIQTEGSSFRPELPSAHTLGLVHSPALRCKHNEVSEVLEDVAETKHVSRSNSA